MKVAGRSVGRHAHGVRRVDGRAQPRAVWAVPGRVEGPASTDGADIARVVISAFVFGSFCPSPKWKSPGALWAGWLAPLLMVMGVDHKSQGGGSASGASLNSTGTMVKPPLGDLSFMSLGSDQVASVALSRLCERYDRASENCSYARLSSCSDTRGGALADASAADALGVPTAGSAGVGLAGCVVPGLSRSCLSLGVLVHLQLFSLPDI